MSKFVASEINITITTAMTGRGTCNGNNDEDDEHEQFYSVNPKPLHLV